MDENEVKTGTEEEVSQEVSDKEKIEQLTKALNAERGMRKSLEQKQKEDAKEEEEEIKSAENKLREKLKAGKSELSDEVIDDLMNTFGSDIAKNQVKSAKREVEREIMELKRDPIYRDIEEHGKEIRQLMKKGLTAEEAYWAVSGKNKFSSAEKTKDEQETKEEQEKLNKERAGEGYVSGVAGADDRKPRFTETENVIARETGKTAEEIKARSGIQTLEQILANNKKFKRK